MSNTYRALQQQSLDTAQQFRLCHDIEGGLALVALLESVAARHGEFTGTQQLELARLIKAILSCQERQDWLGIADYLDVELIQLLDQVAHSAGESLR